jgi:Acetyltransferase (GNAT) domain
MGSGHGLIYGSTARTRSLLSLRLTAIFLTLTVVTQPGFRPACEAAAYFKDHYLYDPSRAFPALSKKAREHLRRAEQSCAFDVVTRFDERMTIAGLYEELRRRRGLAGTFFDFPRIHFETVARLDGAVFFRVRNGHDVCAMACGFAFGDWIQLLHIAITDAGLRQDASYCLMNAMLEFARSERRLLCMGGLPRYGDEGLKRFKTRWSNRQEPVFLLRIVNDRAAYTELVRGREDERYFPAYRATGGLFRVPA